MSISENQNDMKFAGIRLPSVCQMFDTSPTTIWRWAKSRNGFPKPIKLSGSVTVWDYAELNAWIEARKTERTAGTAPIDKGGMS